MRRDQEVIPRDATSKLSPNRPVVAQFKESRDPGVRKGRNISQS